MSGFHQRNRAPQLFSTGGTWGEAQIVAISDAVVIDLTGRRYDRHGHLALEQAVVRLPLVVAMRIHALLAEAITAADELEPRQQAFSLGFAGGPSE
jgi:hypothetical protein